MIDLPGQQDNVGVGFQSSEGSKDEETGCAASALRAFPPLRALESATTRLSQLVWPIRLAPDATAQSSRCSAESSSQRRTFIRSRDSRRSPSVMPTVNAELTHAAMPSAEVSLKLGITQPLCVVTRLAFPDTRGFLRFIGMYLAIKRKARRVPGMIAVTVLLGRNRTATIISLWNNSDSIADFGTRVPEHIVAVNWLFQSTRARSWSGIYELLGVTPSSKAVGMPW